MIADACMKQFAVTNEESIPNSSFVRCSIALDILRTAQITSGRICADSHIARCSSKKGVFLTTQMRVVQEEDETYY